MKFRGGSQLCTKISYQSILSLTVRIKEIHMISTEFIHKFLGTPL